jgi:hypothetical protein
MTAPSPARVAALYATSSQGRTAFDASQMSDDELKDMADFLASQVDGMDDMDVAYGAYVAHAVPGDRQRILTKLLPKLFLSYRKRLVEWFEHALMKRAKAGGGGTGIKKVENGLASFVEAIPEALAGGKAINLAEYLPETEYLDPVKLDPVADTILRTVRKDAVEAGVLGARSASLKTAKPTGLSVKQDIGGGVWFIPPTFDTYPIRQTLSRTYRFRWNAPKRRWETRSLTPQIKRDFLVEGERVPAPQGAPTDVPQSLKEWYFGTWLPKNIHRFTTVFTNYARDKQSSYGMVFSLSGNKVQVKFVRKIDNVRDAVEELRYRYKDRHGREPWLEVMDKFIELVRTTNPSQLPAIIDRINNLQHSNGLFMEHFPADVQQWYEPFLNAKYSAPTADELARYIGDRDLKNLLATVAKPPLKFRPQDWVWQPPGNYHTMTKELQDIGTAVNWREKGYPKYKKSIPVDRFDPDVQDGLDVLKKLHEKREVILSTEIKTPEQLERVQKDVEEWSKKYEEAKDAVKRSLEAQRQRELRTPGYAAAWEAINFPDEFLERFPYSVPGVSRSMLTNFLTRYGSMARRVAERKALLDVRAGGGQTLTSPEYLRLHPDTPRHMIDLPGGRGGLVVDSGFVLADELLGWPQYEGGYLHWRIFDVRKYPKTWKAWQDYADTPFRVYLSDYDDWSVEAMYPTLREAQAVVRALQADTLTMSRVRSLGLATT